MGNIREAAAAALRHVMHEMVRAAALYLAVAFSVAFLFLVLAAMWVHPFWSLLTYGAILGAASVAGELLDRETP